MSPGASWQRPSAPSVTAFTAVATPQREPLEPTVDVTRFLPKQRRLNVIAGVVLAASLLVCAFGVRAVIAKRAAEAARVASIPEASATRAPERDIPEPPPAVAVPTSTPVPASAADHGATAPAKPAKKARGAAARKPSAKDAAPKGSTTTASSVADPAEAAIRRAIAASAR